MGWQVVLMSATLDSDLFASYFGGCPALAAGGRTFPVEQVFLEDVYEMIGYRLDPDQEIHALRMLRSLLHGFATLEAIGSFQIDADVDDSFTWMIGFIDQGLKAGRNH